MHADKAIIPFQTLDNHMVIVSSLPHIRGVPPYADRLEVLSGAASLFLYWPLKVINNQILRGHVFAL